ncbi:hypothetical protein KSS87_018236 [Heliosperma pusillum]|nr:hypothetical protein KSS87_018236 [Heliosperma pusillum]
MVIKGSETKVEVYSLKSGCWRVIGVGPCYLIKDIFYGYTPRFANGSVYWVGAPYGAPNYEKVLLKFDLSAESFETILLPGVLMKNEPKFDRTMDMYIQECKGNLTLIKRNRDDDTCSVWLMKEDGVVNSWTKMFDVNIGELGSCGMPRAFGFRNNGEVIMVEGDQNNIYADSRSNNVVISTDLVTRHETTLRETSVDCNSFYLSTYVESMVLFKEGKGIEEQTMQLDLL